MLLQLSHFLGYSPACLNALLYIGPGMDGGFISLVIAFLVSFFTFITAVIWYPIKKVFGFLRRLTGIKQSKTGIKKNIPEIDSEQ
jgi:hypothetical protein